MRNLNKELENRIINYDKLVDYGFLKKENSYYFEKTILNNQFKVIIEISKKESISKVIDTSLDEEYILVDVVDATGDFIGTIKDEYENILKDIIVNCTTINVFKSRQSKELIKYAKEKYNDELEFLWEKFSENAVLRNQNNKKWYAVFLIIPENKLGLVSDKKIEIIDLRYQKEEIDEIVDNEKVFRGYHMNKKSWITIKLDDSVDIKRIFELLDNSYNLSKEK